MKRHPRDLFAPLGPTYDRTAALLSFGQDPRWRRFLVSRVQARPSDTVLDVATGTGAVAIALVRGYGCAVVGIDQSAEMLGEARRRVLLHAATRDIKLMEGRAEDLPFEDGSFDALTFTYLLRYVDDPVATLRELARVVKPGGTIASLEFGVPGGLPRPRGSSTCTSGCRSPGVCCRLAGGESGRSSAAAFATTGRTSRATASSRCGARPGSTR